MCIFEYIIKEDRVISIPRPTWLATFKTNDSNNVNIIVIKKYNNIRESRKSLFQQIQNFLMSFSPLVEKTLIGANILFLFLFIFILAKVLLRNISEKNSKKKKKN